MKKFGIMVAFLSATMMGCSLSPTTLSCGISEGDSYVTLENLKDNAPQTLRTYAELCGFAYVQEDEPVAKLNILGAN